MYYAFTTCSLVSTTLEASAVPSLFPPVPSSIPSPDPPVLHRVTSLLLRHEPGFMAQMGAGYGVDAVGFPPAEGTVLPAFPSPATNVHTTL